jgi:hypothetical protein
MTICLWSRQQLKAAVRAVGCTTDGFEEFIADEGVGQMEARALHVAAEAAGIAGGGSVPLFVAHRHPHASSGVPHYVVPPSITPDARSRSLFGREHLALIRRWLHVTYSLLRDYAVSCSHASRQLKGLQRTDEITPHISHAWQPQQNLEADATIPAKQRLDKF